MVCVILIPGGQADPWITLDGRLNAPAGTAPLATILNGYPIASPPNARVRWPVTTGTQPPWMVAGCDYPVGINRSLYPTNASLRDPATISLSGVAVNSTSHVVTVTGNNVTIDGYDFSLAGGWQLLVKSGATNTTATNCLFQVGTNANAMLIIGTTAGDSENFIMRYCELDGNFTQDTFNNVLIIGVGSWTLEYNYFHSAFSDFMNLQLDGLKTIRYNLFYNNGVDPSHSDWLQLFAGAFLLNISWNLFVEPDAVNRPVGPGGSIGTQGLTMDQDIPPFSYVGNSTIDHNTMLALPNALFAPYFTFITVADLSAPTITFVTHDNYCDPRGITTGFGSEVAINEGASASYPASRYYNNIRVTDGTLFPGTG